jgi:hypothetical protein
MTEHVDQVQRWPTSNRDLLTTTATAVPVWNFYGFAARFSMTPGRRGVPSRSRLLGLNACYVIVLPFRAEDGRPFGLPPPWEG